MITATPAMPTRAFRAVWIAGAVGVVLSVALAGWFRREARQRDQARFDQITYQLVEDLDTRTEKIEAMLRELARVLSAQPSPSLSAWDEFMNQTSPGWNFPGVVAIGYATNHLTPQVMAAMNPWLREAAPRSRSDFFTLQDPLNQPRRWGTWMVEAYREDVQPVARFAQEDRAYSIEKNVFQRARFQAAPGVLAFEAQCPFEMRSLPGGESRVAYQDRDTDQVQDAAARDDVQISQRASLLQRTNGMPLSLATMVVPVAHPRRREGWDKLIGDERRSDDQHWLRWQFNAGLIFAGLDYTTILKQIQGETPPEVEVDIYSDYANPTVANWLNPTAPPHEPGSSGRESAPSPPGRKLEPTHVGCYGSGVGKRRATFERRHTWPMYGDRWTLRLHTTPVFDQRSTRGRAWWAGGLGLLTTGLFCWALTRQIRGRQRETQRAAELHEARDALQAAQKERERLSHDLHDGVIQSLYAIQLGFTRIESEVEAVAPATARQLAEGRANLDGVIGELREFLTETKRTEGRIPAAGLAAVLHSLVQRLQPASAVPIKLECDAVAAERLTSAQAVQLTALAREALSNSLRHAHAQSITMRLSEGGTTVMLEVMDDGTGFTLAGTGSDGIGLVTMRRRAESLGAVLDLQTAPGRGTRIRVAVPVAAEPEREDDDE